MPRYGVKTYSRGAAKPKVEEPTNKFDQVFGGDSAKRPLAAKASSKTQKWGNTTFTAVRMTRRHNVENEQQVEHKRRRLNSDDPFSFDSSDDDHSSRRGLRTSPRKNIPAEEHSYTSLCKPAPQSMGEHSYTARSVHKPVQPKATGDHAYVSMHRPPVQSVKDDHTYLSSPQKKSTSDHAYSSIQKPSVRNASDDYSDHSYAHHVTTTSVLAPQPKAVPPSESADHSYAAHSKPVAPKNMSNEHSYAASSMKSNVSKTKLKEGKVTAELLFDRAVAAVSKSNQAAEISPKDNFDMPLSISRSKVKETPAAKVEDDPFIFASPKKNSVNSGKDAFDFSDSEDGLSSDSEKKEQGRPSWSRITNSGGSSVASSGTTWSRTCAKADSSAVGAGSSNSMTLDERWASITKSRPPVRSYTWNSSQSSDDDESPKWPGLPQTRTISGGQPRVRIVVGTARKTAPTAANTSASSTASIPVSCVSSRLGSTSITSKSTVCTTQTSVASTASRSQTVLKSYASRLSYAPPSDESSLPSSSQGSTSSKLSSSQPSTSGFASLSQPSTSKGSQSLPPSQSSARDEDPFGFEEEELPSRSQPTASGEPRKPRKFYSPKKSPAKVRYNPRPWQPSTSESFDDAEVYDHDDDDDEPATAPLLLTRRTSVAQRSHHAPVTALRVPREQKELYTVVSNVKNYNDCIELGETQEFSDDIEYLLDGLKNTESAGTRCLSLISLATKCLAPIFRLQLRAHGTVNKVFGELQDASSDPALSLCTALLMYMLSRDRMNMDLDSTCLQLMIQLLCVDAQPTEPTDGAVHGREYNKIREKVQQLCEKTNNKHLKMNTISAGLLAMECLLTLTSKRAGDSFKEEVRKLGGLDRLADMVMGCEACLGDGEKKPDDPAMLRLRKMDRCLRVLENMTFMNTDNQGYLLSYKDAELVGAVVRALKSFTKMCEHFSDDDSLPLNSQHEEDDSVLATPGTVVRSCLLALLRVLLNLTHDNEWGSTKVGEQPGLLKTALLCVLLAPQYLPTEQRFDMHVLGLGLLINLLEHSAKNRRLLTETRAPFAYDSVGTSPERRAVETTAVEALIKLFLDREAAAREAEGTTEQAEQSGEWRVTGDGLEWVSGDSKEEEEKKEEEPSSQEDEKDVLSKALHKAGKHMEDSIVSSYVALLLGCFVQESEGNVESVRQHLPNGDFSRMVTMLKKFLSFISLTNAVGNKGDMKIAHIIDVLEEC
ncbi:wings apart-like protein homolog isoform X2 [Branchiostoma lanceolatum]|uniref:wings apart-like protein homolog isoform X2 n=1 Tax=Branchiostoma lanceolatum TaxID=7740 RepID=UPI0034519CCE